MPNLEEALMNTVRNSSNGDGEGSFGSNGASRPASPSSQPSSPDRNQAAAMEIEHAFEGSLPKPQQQTSSGLAGKAAQSFGNEAHQSTDIL